MGMAAMLVMWPKPFEQLFFPKSPGGCIRNLVAIGSVVSEEKSFEIVDGWTEEPAYTISSPEAFGSGELNTIFFGGRGGEVSGWGWARESEISSLWIQI